MLVEARAASNGSRVGAALRFRHTHAQFAQRRQVVAVSGESLFHVALLLARVGGELVAWRGADALADRHRHRKV